MFKTAIEYIRENNLTDKLYLDLKKRTEESIDFFKDDVDALGMKEMLLQDLADFKYILDLIKANASIEEIHKNIVALDTAPRETIYGCIIDTKPTK